MAGTFKVGISVDFGSTAAGLLEPALEGVLRPHPRVEWGLLPEAVAEQWADGPRQLDAPFRREGAAGRAMWSFRW